jgi:hypothetical protein
MGSFPSPLLCLPMMPQRRNDLRTYQEDGIPGHYTNENRGTREEFLKNVKAEGQSGTEGG